jgi:hypothetical protein
MVDVQFSAARFAAHTNAGRSSISGYSMTPSRTDEDVSM